ncbi:hypothetical protein B296_00047178 [Ensete ventricosum]|uniref:Uncharacterized protein n=1 Tax=Ensete ventricosum TaxID=4639 RepID=A0A426Z0R6_ENSVE|nr:hypothetical protein B296_00047178 [Ensete ventricosum]
MNKQTRHRERNQKEEKRSVFGRGALFIAFLVATKREIEACSSSFPADVGSSCSQLGREGPIPESERGSVSPAWGKTADPCHGFGGSEICVPSPHRPRTLTAAWR